MSELSKNQLTTENNNSFPNNNTGFITPTLLREFNKDIIDSMVDEISYNADSASFNTRINLLDPSGSAAAIQSLEAATASLNAYTQSQNSFNSSATASIVALQGFSSSLDATFATDTQLSASVAGLSASIAVTDSAQSQSIAALQQFSSSLDTTFATDAQLSASASTLQNNINTLSSSVAVTDSAQSASIAALQQFSSSLDNTFATDTQLSASASTLQNAINLKVNTSVTSSMSVLSASFATTASFALNVTPTDVSPFLSQSTFNQYTQSNDSKVTALINQTGSYATKTELNQSSSTLQNDINSRLLTGSFNSFTQSVNTNISQINARVSSSATTGSNTFIGNQIVSGNVNIAGNITALSASITYLETIFQTSSIIFSSGSNQFGDELIDVQTLSGSVRVQGGLTVNGVNVQTAAFDASGFLLTSSFNTYTQSQVTISQSFDNRINGIVVTPFLSASDFNQYTQSNNSVVNTLVSATASYANSASVAGITSASQGQINSLITNTGSYVLNSQTSSMSVLSASFAQTASFALNVTPTDVTPFLSKSAFDTYTGSAALGVSESINSATQSLSQSIASTNAAQLFTSSFNTYTSSQATINSGLQSALALKLNTTTFNSYTQSNDTKVNGLISQTSSYALASFVNNLSGAISQTDATQSIQISNLTAATGSYITSAQTGGMSVLSASFAVTASFALNASATVDTGSLVTTASFNAYTQSNNSVVNALVSATASYAISSSVAAIDASQDGKIGALIAETASYAKLNVANVFTQNQTISGNLAVTGKITALSASITYLETIFQTSSVVYSSGSNIFGDELSDTQTLSGSVLIEGSLRVNGILPILVGQTASFASASISSSHALSASFAQTASFLLGSVASSSFATTASFALNTTPTTESIVTAVVTNQGSGYYIIDGVNQPKLSFVPGPTYRFDLSGIAGNHPFKFSTSPNGPTQYTTGVISGSNFIQIQVGYDTTTPLYYYCTNHSGMGNEINVLGIEKLATTASLNSYTQSNNSVVNALVGVTGSFATTGSNRFVGTQTITGSVVISGSVFNAKVDPSTLSVGVTNLKTLFETTQSGVPSQIDLTRLGAGATGDLTGVRLQTLSGSDTTGDTLLSRITTGVNRHTSTAMTGSVVNSTITSTWATGSGGTRVSYGTTINANAQSASATLTMTVGNAASNNAGGTASIAAGLIRIGTSTAHNISLTGSIVSGITLSGSSLSATPMLRIRTSGSNGNAFEIESGSVLITTPQGQGSFYSNIPITSSHGRFNGQSFIKRLNIEDNAGSADLQVENNVSITGSLTVGGGTGQIFGSASYAAFALIALSSSFATNANTAITATSASFASNASNATTASFANTALSASFAIAATTALSSSFATTASFALSTATDNSLATTGSNIFKGVQIISSSVRGEQYVGSIAGTTASFDCSTGNFFTLVLGSGVNHISASNIRQGQTVNVRVTTQTSNTANFSTAIKQPSGSIYVPTNGAGTDILTFISYDTTLFMVSAKNFI